MLLYEKCAVPENISERREVFGSLRLRLLKKFIRLDWNFQRGLGKKISSVGEVWIFPQPTECTFGSNALTSVVCLCHSKGHCSFP